MLRAGAAGSARTGRRKPLGGGGGYCSPSLAPPLRGHKHSLGLAAWLVAFLPGAALILAPPAPAQSTTGYDDDNDGLIGVRNLAQLNAMRHDLNGGGAPVSTDATAYGTAFPNRVTGASERMGCPTSGGCTDYELRADSFDENGDGQMTATGASTYWNSGAGWLPIGNAMSCSPRSGATATPSLLPLHQPVLGHVAGTVRLPGFGLQRRGRGGCARRRHGAAERRHPRRRGSDVSSSNGSSCSYVYVPSSTAAASTCTPVSRAPRAGTPSRSIPRPVVSSSAATAASFAGGNASPVVGTAVTVSALPSHSDRTFWRWQRCTANDGTGACTLLAPGEPRWSYTPAAADAGGYLRAFVYYSSGAP